MYLDTGAVKNLKVLRAFLKIETDKQIVQDVSKQMWYPADIRALV